MTEQEQNNDNSNFSADQRRSERINYDFPVYFYFLSGKRKPREVTYHKGYTQNVSTTGIRMVIPSPGHDVRKMFEEFDMNLGLEIYLPAVFRAKPITCKGKLIWKKEIIDEELNIEVGIELMNLDDFTRDIIQKVANNLKKITDSINDEDVDLA